MTNAKLGEALRLLGIDHAAGQVYLALLELAPAPLSAIAAAAALDGAELAAAYGALVDAGLASAAEEGGDVVAPVPPAAGLEILARHRAAEVEESRIAVGGAFESFRRQRLAAYNDNLVEVVTGDAVGPGSVRPGRAPASRSGSLSRLRTSPCPAPRTTRWPRSPAV